MDYFLERDLILEFLDLFLGLILENFLDQILETLDLCLDRILAIFLGQIPARNLAERQNSHCPHLVPW